jgi:hypothetical protein
MLWSAIVYVNDVDQRLEEYCGENAYWGADDTSYRARASRTCLRLPSWGIEYQIRSFGRTKHVKISVSNNVTASLSGA